MGLRILHTNDLHGREALARESLEKLRPQHDLYFDSGDHVAYGNMAIPMRVDPSWKFLNDLQCSASTLGNRETHFMRSVLNRKLKGADHAVVCCNMFDKQSGLVLPASTVLSAKGLNVGVIGAMIEMTAKKDKLAGLSVGEMSPLYWEKAEPLVQIEASRLRRECDVVILLSHLGFKRDVALAESNPNLDIILGGHSHHKLKEPHQVGTVFIAQGGSRGFYAGSYQWEEGRLTGGLVATRPLKEVRPS